MEAYMLYYPFYLKALELKNKDLEELVDKVKKVVLN
jgi:hypothetical protein